MEYNKQQSNSKRKLQHTLGESKTSYGAWDRQAKANLKHHLRHLEWVERGIRHEIIQISYEILNLAHLDQME